MASYSKKNLLLTAVLLILSACGGGSGNNNPPPVINDPPPGPVLFHCAKDSSCPELLVVGDPHAEINMLPDSFRGYGDPSLEYDSETHTLWMIYSWLNTQISDPGPPVVFDLGVRTHLARSDDGGNTFNFVRTVNDMEMEAHPFTGEMGWSTHEVATLVKEPAGSWQVLWLKYFNPFGTVIGVDERQEFLYWRSTADSPDELGNNSEVWGRSIATSPTWGAPVYFNDISELADCIIQTEPGLFTFNNETYLATSCLVVDATGRRTDLERLVLLRQTANGYTFVGNIVDGQDAADLGVVTQITQQRSQIVCLSTIILMAF